MHHLQPPINSRALDAFVELAGTRAWAMRIHEISQLASSGPRAGQAIRQRHAVELAIERLRGTMTRPPSQAELQAAQLAADARILAQRLGAQGRAKFHAMLDAALVGEGTLIPLFHLLRTAALQRSRGFAVEFAGLEADTNYDLLLRRGTIEAEIACDVVSAESGRLLHRSAWSHLADRVDPDLRSWLTRSPGRYLLKITLPYGLQGGWHEASADNDALGVLHGRILRLLATGRRDDHDERTVLRLDPLPPGDERAGTSRLLASLRQAFGPESHLSITATGGGVFAMAARAGRQDEIAAAVRRRLTEIVATRLTGTRPGILAMFIEDTDRSEWRGMRERLELEGEARQFLAHKHARPVIAVTCASRLELFGMPAPDGAAGGELRFRNPSHPAARMPALAAAVMSSV